MKSFLKFAAIIAGSLLISWGFTVGVIKLITMCFGWGFSLPAATGIWLLIILAQGIFRKKGGG